jgi:hypothetical protein
LVRKRSSVQSRSQAQIIVERNLSTIGVERRERHHHFGMLNLQAPELQRHQEQEETDRKG